MMHRLTITPPELSFSEYSPAPTPVAGVPQVLPPISPMPDKPLPQVPQNTPMGAASEFKSYFFGPAGATPNTMSKLFQEKLKGISIPEPSALDSFTHVQQRRILAIKKCQKEYDELKKKLFEEELDLISKYEKEYLEVFKKRNEIVIGLYEPKEEELSPLNEKPESEVPESERQPIVKRPDGSDRGIPDYWVDAICNSVIDELVSPKDEKVLHYLEEIRVRRLDSAESAAIGGFPMVPKNPFAMGADDPKSPLRSSSTSPFFPLSASQSHMLDSSFARACSAYPPQIGSISAPGSAPHYSPLVSPSSASFGSAQHFCFSPSPLSAHSSHSTTPVISPHSPGIPRSPLMNAIDKLKEEEEDNEDNEDNEGKEGKDKKEGKSLKEGGGKDSEDEKQKGDGFGEEQAEELFPPAAPQSASAASFPSSPSALSMSSSANSFPIATSSSSSSSSSSSTASSTASTVSTASSSSSTPTGSGAGMIPPLLTAVTFIFAENPFIANKELTRYVIQEPTLNRVRSDVMGKGTKVEWKEGMDCGVDEAEVPEQEIEEEEEEEGGKGKGKGAKGKGKGKGQKKEKNKKNSKPKLVKVQFATRSFFDLFLNDEEMNEKLDRLAKEEKMRKKVWRNKHREMRGKVEELLEKMEKERAKRKENAKKGKKTQKTQKKKKNNSSNKKQKQGKGGKGGDEYDDSEEDDDEDEDDDDDMITPEFLASRLGEEYNLFHPDEEAFIDTMEDRATYLTQMPRQAVIPLLTENTNCLVDKVVPRSYYYFTGESVRDEEEAEGEGGEGGGCGCCGECTCDVDCCSHHKNHKQGHSHGCAHGCYCTHD